MTGGQMAPTTTVGQITTTTPWGRDPAKGDGWPLKISEMLSGLEGVCLSVRCSVSSPKEILITEKYIKKAFLNQIDKKGFSIVEILSSCPAIWRKDPLSAIKWIEEEMVKVFPLGVIKEK